MKLLLQSLTVLTFCLHFFIHFHDGARFSCLFMIPLETFNPTVHPIVLKDVKLIGWISSYMVTRFLMASNVWQLEEHEDSCGSRKLQVTILASEWGSRKGVLSTFNRELAGQLVKFSCVDVTFFLLKCPYEDTKAATSHGISILTAARRAGYHDELDWLSFPPDDLRIH